METKKILINFAVCLAASEDEDLEVGKVYRILQDAKASGSGLSTGHRRVGRGLSLPGGAVHGFGFTRGRAGALASRTRGRRGLIG